MLETVCATAILWVAMCGLIPLFAIAMSVNSNQGEMGTRCTEYAQDKMEQLLALRINKTSDGSGFTDTTSDTTVYPTATTGGTGLSAGGSIVLGSPVTSPGTGYVDYLASDGTPLGSASTPPATAFYVRQWQITLDASGNFKTVYVIAAPLSSASTGQNKVLRQVSTTLVSYLANVL